MINQRSRNGQKDELIAAIFLWLMLNVCAKPVDLPCSDKRGNYTTNSPFENNLKHLLNSLPENAAQNEGFNITSFGDGDNKVSGRALCRGDINQMDCEKCLWNATREIKGMCQTKEAHIYMRNDDQLCQVEYGGTPSNRYNGIYPEKPEKSVSTDDPNGFSRALMELMGDISNEAAFSSRLMFATQKIRFSRQITIYALAQCTRDLSKEDCSECLKSASQDLIGHSGTLEGGAVYSDPCFLRFQIYQFYYARGGTRNKEKTRVAVVAAVLVFATMAVLVGSYAQYRRKRKRASKSDEEGRTNYLTIVGRYVLSSPDMPFVEVPIINAAPEIFLDFNKLGQGGFGAVYKGVLPSGEEVAVKRLFRNSLKGVEALKNEVMLIAKLQHRNLVRLLGCDLEGNEKLLIYEYMPNKSLDFFLFDSEKRSMLDWKTRFNVIDGIARALVYLHEDSRLKIIHRDLKPSNILLDRDMVAKISDFGIARIFSESQNTTNTRRVVGTYGYMAPEYAMGGLFSVKSDVFSFGVILLEIVSGQRNSSFYIRESSKTLLSYAWQLMNEEKELELVDPLLLIESSSSSSMEEMVRCIRIGLLCVQEDPSERPKMSEVVHLLKGGEMALSKPSPPPISIGRRCIHDDNDFNPSSTRSSVNHLTDSIASPG